MSIRRRRRGFKKQHPLFWSVLCSVILIPFGIMLIASSFSLSGGNGKNADDYIEVPAVITDVRTSQEGTGTHRRIVYYYDCEYSVDGQPYTINNLSSQTNKTKGQSIRIFVHKDDPNNWTTTVYSGSAGKTSFWLGIIMLLAGVLILVLSIIIARKEAKEHMTNREMLLSEETWQRLQYGNPPGSGTNNNHNDNQIN